MSGPQPFYAPACSSGLVTKNMPARYPYDRLEPGERMEWMPCDVECPREKECLEDMQTCISRRGSHTKSGAELAADEDAEMMRAEYISDCIADENGPVESRAITFADQREPEIANPADYMRAMHEAIPPAPEGGYDDGTGVTYYIEYHQENERPGITGYEFLKNASELNIGKYFTTLHANGRDFAVETKDILRLVRLFYEGSSTSRRATIIDRA